LPVGSQNMQGVATRLDQLKALISKRDSEYYRGPTSAKLQQEYIDLLAAQDRIKSRAA
jgi:hypothetical protein